MSLRHRGMPTAALRTFLVASALCASASSAQGAECTQREGLTGCVDSDNLWMSAGATRFFSIGPGLTTPTGKFSFGLGLSYLSRPIGLRVGSPDEDGTVVYVVDNAVNATFLWSLGLTNRFDVTVAAPMTLYQDGAGLYAITGSDDELPRAGIRDLRIGFDFAAIPRARAGRQDGLALLGRFAFGVPIGVKDGLAGGRSVTWIPSVLGEYRLLDRLTIAAEVTARVRETSVLEGTKVGTQIGGSLGVSVDILPRYLTASAEAFLLYGLDTQPPVTRLKEDFDAGPPLAPAEWIASVSSAPLLGGDLSASIGGGTPIPLADQSAVTNPRFRFDLAIRYAPTGRDADADGVLDRDDQCPGSVEDRDGFEDTDGCPELDNDGDRIPDDRDRCRDAAETVDGFKDEDGCPDPDDDGDKVPDESDQCRNLPEDIDGYKDADGCPDPDNDGDGVPDEKDLCKNGAEDPDGFKDEDGCPEPDNDSDDVLDKDDLCPIVAEDKDGLVDTDGCPETDADEDGVLDPADVCPTSPETIDGQTDGDGCPEQGGKPLVKWQGDQALLDPPQRFPAGSATPSPELEKKLAMLAQLVRGASPELVIIEAYADRLGDTSAKAAELADKRALAIKAAFTAAGIPEAAITAVGGDAKAARAADAPAFDVLVRRPRKAAPKKAAPAAPPEKR